MIEKLLSPSSKENGSIVIGKLENCLEDHYHVLVLCFLDHGDTLVIVIVIHLAYGGYFFAKGLSNYAKVLSFCMKMPGITPNWTAVYGCTSDVLWISPILALSVLSLLNP